MIMVEIVTLTYYYEIDDRDCNENNILIMYT